MLNFLQDKNIRSIFAVYKMRDIMNTVAIETVKKGEFIRINGNAKKVKTYLKQDYCRFNKAYECVNWDDINDVKYLKKGKQVLTGFDF